MMLGRWDKRALATLSWHDSEKVEYSEAKGRKNINEMQMQITLKTTCTAMLTIQSKNKNRCRLV